LGEIILKKTREIMVYAGDVHLVGENVNGMKKHREAVMIATRMIQL
jgi:hypothetical protein